jgi:cell division protein FtsB
MSPAKPAYQAAWDDRNALARQVADLRDERNDLLRRIAALEDHIEIIDDDRRGLCDALEQATGRNWTDEQARSWSS